MFAVVDIAGKQYRVAAGDKLTVDRISGKNGESVAFEKVLLLSDGKTTKVGKPTVKGAKVTAKILSQAKGEKVEVRRFKHKVRYRRARGFRPQTTNLEIISIS